MDQDLLKTKEEFHDAWADSIDVNTVLVDEFMEACTVPENRIILREIGDLKGKKILELGCVAGEASVYFAKKGADVVATDISTGMLKVVERLAEKHQTSLSTKQSTTDKIDFPNETFDIVYAANLLHHIDIVQSLPEIKRVLKKGGKFYSWDPVAHNPLINIYRKMASDVRTEDEHPIKMKELKIFKQNFQDVKFHTTWFFTLWIFIRFYLIERVSPNQERYWKKIVNEHKRLEKLYYRLERMDNAFLKLFPFMKRYCWNIVIIAQK